MAVTVEVHGSQQLRAIARALREAKRTDLDRQLGEAMRDGSKDVELEIRKHTDDYMPAGYEITFAKALRFKIEVRKSYEYRVTVVAYAQGRGRERHLKTMERGELRAPNWGRWRRRRGKNLGKHKYRNPWHAQRIRPHWMTEPATRAAPEVRRRLEKAMQAVADKIERAG